MTSPELPGQRVGPHQIASATTLKNEPHGSNAHHTTLNSKFHSDRRLHISRSAAPAPHLATHPLSRSHGWWRATLDRHTAELRDGCQRVVLDFPRLEEKDHERTRTLEVERCKTVHGRWIRQQLCRQRLVDTLQIADVEVDRLLASTDTKNPFLCVHREHSRHPLALLRAVNLDFQVTGENQSSRVLVKIVTKCSRGTLRPRGGVLWVPVFSQSPSCLLCGEPLLTQT